MNQNNNKKKGNKQGATNAKQIAAEVKRQVMNDIRQAAGQPAKGKGRGGRNRQAKKQASAAAAYATGQSGQGAKIQATRESCRVSHREFIGNVTGSVAFAIAATLAINPGLAASFPWLSGIAQNWETYRFRKLRLCYYTRTGSNVPGSVILAHDPDASDAAPVSEQVMTTYEKCEEDAPWKDICMEFSLLGLNDLGPRKFVRAGALAANQDVKLYDSGNAFVGTVDGTAVAWGKLWFEYDVDFFTPQLPAAGSGMNVAVATSTTATVAGPGIGMTFLGSIGAAFTGTSLGLTNLVVGNEYHLTYLNSSGTGVTFAASALVGCTLKSNLIANSTSICGLTFTATANTASMTVTLGSNPPSAICVIAAIPTVSL